MVRGVSSSGMLTDQGNGSSKSISTCVLTAPLAPAENPIRNGFVSGTQFMPSSQVETATPTILTEGALGSLLSGRYLQHLSLFWGTP